MEAILDASAILALLLNEPGHLRVERVLDRTAGACTVTLAEIVGRFSRAGAAPAETRRMLSSLRIVWLDTDHDLAYRAGELALASRPFGLSLGDRFCIALAMRKGLPAVTADQAWSKAASAMGFAVDLIR